jgi:hypothetical protein
MNKWLSVVVLALLIVVAGLAWRGALQSAAQGKNVSVLTAQGSRPYPPQPPSR